MGAPKTTTRLMGIMKQPMDAYSLLVQAATQGALVPAKYLWDANDMVDTGARLVTREEFEALSGPVTTYKVQPSPNASHLPAYMTGAVMEKLRRELPASSMRAALANRTTDDLARELDLDCRVVYMWAKLTGSIVTRRGGYTVKQLSEKEDAHGPTP